LIAEQGEPDPADPAQTRLGGHFVTDPPIWPH
ncbi:NAD-dependent epimerase/dehydratase family protein, partial [Streptomyces griseus]